MLDAGPSSADRRIAHEITRQQERSAADRRKASRASSEDQEGSLYPTLFDDAEQNRIQILRSAIFPAPCFRWNCAAARPQRSNSSATIRLARNAVSLGGVETLVCHPKTTTHSGFTEEQFAQAGVTEGLVRVSIGIEDWRDLLADFPSRLWRPFSS